DPNIEKLIRDYFDAMNTEDHERAIGFYHDDIVYDDQALNSRTSGKQAVTKFYMDFVPGLNPFNIIEEIHTTPDSYAIIWNMKGTHTGDVPGIAATGKPYKGRGASIGRIKDGKIIYNFDCYTTDFISS
ncbi:MAG: nuclear transport factor 2 family protein, partial [Sphingobium sp.]